MARHLHPYLLRTLVIAVRTCCEVSRTETAQTSVQGPSPSAPSPSAPAAQSPAQTALPCRKEFGQRLMYGLEIREPERAVFGTGIQRRRLFGNGIQGRPTLDHKQLGIQRRPLCTRGSREDPKKTGIQGRPPGDPATTFYPTGPGRNLLPESTVTKLPIRPGLGPEPHTRPGPPSRKTYP